MHQASRITLTIVFSFACPILIAAQDSLVTDVPMLFRGPQPAVEVIVNGQGPFLFAIDTGAGFEAGIDTSLVKRLGLKATGKIQGGDPSGSNVMDFDAVRLDTVALGDVLFRNITALARDRRATPGFPNIDGVLGFPLFAEYLLTLDYPSKRVRLERGELPQSNGAELVDFESPHSIPVVDLKVGNLKVKAHIDSGNLVGGFILPASLVKKLSLASTPVAVGKGRTISSEVEIMEARLNDNIALGSHVFVQPTITFPAISDDANIGSKILQEFSVKFDQKNSRVRLVRSLSPSDPPAAESSPKLPAAMSIQSEEYVGRYEPRTISFEDGTLYLQRDGGPKIKLVPVSRDEFTLESIPAARIKFVRDESGKIKELHVLNRAGAWEISRKHE